MRTGPAALCVFFCVTCALVLGMQAWCGAWTGDLSRTGDEAAHFVSAAMIRDYLVQAPGSNPMTFATDYYVHFPRVAIGHWPPFFHVMQAAFFIVTGVSTASALVVQALIAAAAATLTAWCVREQVRSHPAAYLIAAAAGLALLATGRFLPLANAVMLDNFLSVLVLLATLAWARYAWTRQTAWAIAFAICASAAIYTKGNALGPALLPPLHALLTGRIALLFQWRSWLAAALVLVMIAPWYYVSYGISSSGFLYHWGLDFTLPALAEYGRGLFLNIGAIVLAAFVVSAIRIARHRTDHFVEEVAAACVAAFIGLFVFHVIVPVAIDPRYLIIVAPLAIIVANRSLRTVSGGPVPKQSGAMLIAPALLLVNAGLTFTMPFQSPTVLTPLMHRIVADPSRNPFVMIASSSNGEGAMIAAFAAGDPARAHYVIRASAILAETNFSGSRYQQRYDNPDDIMAWIRDNHVGWVVIDTRADSQTMGHNRQLLRLAAADPARWVLVASSSPEDGAARLFRLMDKPPSAAEVVEVVRQLKPTRLIGGSAQRSK